MKPSSRNLGLELVALGLFLASLVLFLWAGLSVFLFLFGRALPNEPPPQAHGVILGNAEAWAGALSLILPAAFLIAIAWGLRSLVVEEGEPDA